MRCRFLALVIYLISTCAANGQNVRPLRVTGVVMDSATRQPLAFASVTLKSSGNYHSEKKIITTGDGFFKLDILPHPGADYLLSVSCVGYTGKAVRLNELADTVNHIFLTAAAGKLKAVTVISSHPVLVRQEIDRISYDVQSDAQTHGQTVMDVLRRVPLITVDGDDNIELQGSSSYRIFINGKPSALLANNPKEVLRSMPADAIQRIEVITTPPAKYESEGLAGIINIITVKKTANGYNGVVSSRYSFPRGPGITVTATSKQDKFGFSGYAGASSQPPLTIGQQNTLQTFTGVPSALVQQGNFTRGGKSVNSDIECSYGIDSIHLLTGSVNYQTGRFNEEYNASSTYATGSANTVVQSYHFINAGVVTWTGADIGFNYEAGFRKGAGRLLTASYRYYYYLGGVSNNTQNSDRFNYQQPDNNQQNDAATKEHTVQVDYIHPIQRLTVEAGAKLIFRNIYSHSGAQVYQSATNEFVSDTSSTDRFAYRQNIYSLYNSYLFKSGNWTVHAGVRAERTTNATTLENSGPAIDYTNLIPSLSVLLELKNRSSISLGITDRLQRPGIQQLNPFVNKSNPQLLSTGNPLLGPVTSHLYELVYSKAAKGTMSMRVSYLYTNNSVVSVTKVIADTVSLTTFDNVGKSRILRFNVTGNYALSRVWNLNFNTGIFYVWISGIYNGQPYSNEGPRTNSFINNSFKLSHRWQLGLSGGYNRRYINLQGSSSDYYYYAASVTKEIRKFSFSAIVNNAFQRFYPFATYTRTPDFYQSNTDDIIYRTVILNVSYKFGGLKGTIKKNKLGIKNDDMLDPAN